MIAAAFSLRMKAVKVIFGLATDTNPHWSSLPTVIGGPMRDMSTNLGMSHYLGNLEPTCSDATIRLATSNGSDSGHSSIGRLQRHD